MCHRCAGCSCNRAHSRTNRRTFAAAGHSSDRGTDCGARSNLGHVVAGRTSAVLLERLRVDVDMLAVVQRKLGQFDFQMGTIACCRLDDAALQARPALCDDPSVHHQLTIERGQEGIAGLVVRCSYCFADADRKDGAGGDGDRG